MSFLPITKEEMTARGWEAADFVYAKTYHHAVCILFLLMLR